MHTDDLAARRVALPPQRYDRVKVFGGLLLVVLLCTPVWLVGIGSGDVTDDHEAATLRVARDTWARHLRAEEGGSWLIPTRGEQPHLDPPPLTTWILIAGWSVPGVEPIEIDGLVLRARIVSALLGLLTVLATYWAGMSIGDARVARLAAAALATTLLFVHQVRSATTDTYMLAWTTLAVAAGLWAMRPLKDVNWVGRRVLGWFIAGLALAAAILTQGAKPAALFVLPPLAAAIALTPRRRFDNAIGLLFACILGVVAVSPWYIHVLHKFPDAQSVLFGKALPPQDLFVLTWSHWRVLIVLSPWAVWLLGAFFQPFIRAEHERRRQLLIAWFWFVMLFVILSIPAARSVRYLTPLLPASALLVGQLWAFHAQLSSERQVDPGVDLLRVPHWLALGLTSILGPLMLWFQPWLVENGYLNGPLLVGLTPATKISLAASLLLIALLGTRWHFKWKPRLAAYATVTWMIAVLAVCLPAYEQSPARSYAYRLDAARLSEAVGDRDVVSIVASQRDEPLDDRLLLYSGLSIRPLAPDQLDGFVQQGPPLAVVTLRDAAYAPRLEGLGFVHVLDFQDGNRPRRLYTLSR